MNKHSLQKLGLDLVFLIGCAIFVYGLSLAWRPLGFIVGGLVLAAIGFFVGYQRPAHVLGQSGAESEN